MVYEGNLSRIAGIFSNSFTGTDRQYVEYENYNSTAPDYDDTWDNLYYVISQAKIGEAKATAGNNKLQMGIFKVIQALITDFLPVTGMANKSNLTMDQALLKEILTERYVTFTGQLEFTDLRRTKNFIGIRPKKGIKIPQRFLYAQSEINTNPNTPKLVAGDLFKETPINSTAY